MADARKSRWFHRTPDWSIFGLLAVEGLLWLSERYLWFSFNERKGWTVLIALAVVGVAMLIMLLWFAVSLLFRRRFQFSIRLLLVLTVAVALPFSWLSWEMQKTREQKEAVDAIRKSVVFVRITYDYQLDSSDNIVLNEKPSVPPAAWNLLPDDFFDHVVKIHFYNHDTTDAKLEPLKRLPQLQVLNLTDLAGHGCGVAASQAYDVTQKAVPGVHQGLRRGAGESQRFDPTRIAVPECNQGLDAGLEQLRDLTSLKILDLFETHVTDAGLKHLEGLTQLQQLDLKNTQVTDAGLKHLEGLTQLQWLGLREPRSRMPV